MRRTTNLEDPWISIEDHAVARDNGTILYGTDAYDCAPKYTEALTTYGGADVYIRNRVDCTGYVDYHSHSQTNDSTFAYVNENNILILDTNLARKEDF
jgi:hypothetical protein